MYKPDVQQFATPITVQARTITIVNGQKKTTYANRYANQRLCGYKPFYGSEAIQAGQLGVVEGGTITTWYDAGIEPTDRIILNGNAYDIMTPPENIENRNMYLTFKIKRVVST